MKAGRQLWQWEIKRPLVRKVSRWSSARPRQRPSSFSYSPFLLTPKKVDVQVPGNNLMQATSEFMSKQFICLWIEPKNQYLLESLVIKVNKNPSPGPKSKFSLKTTYCICFEGRRILYYSGKIIDFIVRGYPFWSRSGFSRQIRIEQIN